MSHSNSASLELPKLDRWLQRLSAAAMLALALSLVGLGLALYLPNPAHHPMSSLSEKEAAP
ncbi:MAG: hypothetical protein ACYC8T_10930 [Myxococcaceae bacterium]